MQIEKAGGMYTCSWMCNEYGNPCLLHERAIALIRVNGL